MGRVFRALDTRLGRTVALKVLSRHQASDMETLMRFRNEARSAARLNHPGIAQVYYVGEDNGLPFIAFEFIEGTNVRDLVGQKGALSLAEALSYTLQVAEALAHAAARNVVHRDIKPSNVLITSEGRARLIDMGLARIEKLGTSVADLTASGVTLGTFDYISPEQARDPRNADVRSDIYSLGCTLFFMLSGRPPFPEGTVLQKLLQHQEIDPPDIRQFRPDLPDEVSRLLRKMMAKEPRRRYADPDKLIVAILSLAEQMGLRALGPGRVAWTEGEEPIGSLVQRHVPWLAPVATLLVVVMLLDYLWTSPVQEDEPATPYWVSEPSESVAQASGLEEPLASGEAGHPSDLPLPGPSELPSGTTTTPKPAPSNVASKQPPVSPDRTVTTAAANGAPRLPPTGAGDTAVEVTTPNPLDALVSTRTDSSNLRPELFDGGISLPGEIASGLSVDPETKGDWGGLSGAAGTATESAETGPLVEPTGQPGRLLVVDPNGEADGAFPTLGAATNAAGDGAVIELRFSGRLDEEPLEVANTQLTIRAAVGFEPVVGFRPSQIDPIGYPRSMFTVIGSRLTLADVAIEFDIPREVSTATWSLFEVGQGERVKLEGCWLTIRNASGRRAAYHQETAFFRLQAAPGIRAGIQDQPPNAAPRAAVELTDCVVRGEAVFLRIEDLQPVDLVWKNGLLITTEQLLVVDGGERAPHPNETIDLELDHVTAVADGGLCRWTQGEFAPHQLPTHVRCANSIVLLAPEASLIEQLGVTDLEQPFERLAWLGDQNVYYGFTAFWTIRPLDPSILSEPWTFDEWQVYWNEESSRLGQIEPDELPAPDRPVHTLTPDDYPSLKVNVTG